MASDINISALMVSQSRWEMAEYAFAGVVAVACFGEFVHECTSWFAGSSLWKRFGGAASALLLIAALAVEIPTQIKVNSISGIIVAELSRQEAVTRLKAADIERKYAWRSILSEQEVLFLTSLGDASFPVILQYFVSDPEAFEFSQQLSHLVGFSKLKITPHNVTPLTPPLGVVVWGDETPERASLAAALTAAKIPFRFHQGILTAIDDPHALRVSVGGRLPPE